MFPILPLGPAAVPVAPIVLLIGVFISAAVVEKRAAQLGLAHDAVSNMVYIALGAGFVGARLGYVLLHLAAYRSDPLSIVVPTPATLDAFSGVVAAILAGALYAKRHRLPLWRTLDALAPGIGTMAIALGFAHLASGDAFGMSAQLPWSIYLWDDFRHPSQVYEITAALIVLGVWWFVADRSPFDGFQFLLVIALFAASIVVLEAFRGDSWLFDGWRVAQGIALGVLAVSLVALRVLSRSASSNTANRGLPT
jgi:phosphatidylglycerol:prolipoprotein diacylglycerol transferase